MNHQILILARLDWESYAAVWWAEWENMIFGFPCPIIVYPSLSG